MLSADSGRYSFASNGKPAPRSAWQQATSLRRARWWRWPCARRLVRRRRAGQCLPVASYGQVSAQGNSGPKDLDDAEGPHP